MFLRVREIKKPFKIFPNFIVQFSMIKIFITFFIFLLIPTSFAEYYEVGSFAEEKTIKEIKSDITTLDKQSLELDTNFKDLNSDYELKSFLKKWLSIIELNKIRRLVSDYNENKNKIDIVLYEKAKNIESTFEENKRLLEEKKKLYVWLTPYIDQDFKEDYLEYIKWDAEIFTKQKIVTTNIIKNKEILNSKVEALETKIKEHRSYIDTSVKNLVNKKLDEKIENLKNNPSFTKLDNESKIKVLDKTIVKIKIKLKNFDSEKVDSNKVQTYNLALSKLIDFQNTLINQ